MNPEILVPVVECGLGTGRARVWDVVRRQSVEIIAEVVTLVGNRVCVRADALDRDGRYHRARFGDGTTAWVEAISGDSDGGVVA
jgi:hypothetical protein